MSKSGTSHSDTTWDSVTVLRKKEAAPKTLRSQADINAAKRAGQEVETDKKWAASTNKQHAGPQNATKLDAQTEPEKIALVPIDVGRAMMQARQAKEWTQKELAQVPSKLRCAVLP